MRFRRWYRPEPYGDTPRKRAAFLRKQRRRQRAAWWRKGRARLFALPDTLRARVREIWRTCPYPADPASFADFLHQIAVGRLDPWRPPWIFHQTRAARITRDPATFDQAFRQIGRRQIRGGPKTLPVDELLFCGNLGSSIVFLRSRVRPIEWHESFYTSFCHRLHDSKVGSGGHYVEIEVTGDCSDAELSTIERIAQAANTRPVAIRRAATAPRTSAGRAAS